MKLWALGLHVLKCLLLTIAKNDLNSGKIKWQSQNNFTTLVITFSDCWLKIEN